MTEKRYYSDWAKAKSRELVKDMIQKTLLKFRKPEELRVLCFPGIDAEEIFQVYDFLGIPRKNIVGVERESDIADILEEKDLGIEVVRETVEDYIRQQQHVAFDVVSLDYIGPLNHDQMETLTAIAQKQIKNHFVLHTANLLRRDKDSTLLYYYGFSTNHLGRKYSSDTEEAVERISNLSMKMNNNLQFIHEKQIGYSTMIEAAVRGTTADLYNQLLKFVFGENHKEVIMLCECIIGEMTGEKVTIDLESKTVPYSHMRWLPLAQKVIEDLTFDSFRESCAKYGIVSEEFPSVLLSAVSDATRKNKFFFPKDASCYSYISESGAPMIGDVYFLSYPERIVGIAKEITGIRSYQAKVFLQFRQ